MPSWPAAFRHRRRLRPDASPPPPDSAAGGSSNRAPAPHLPADITEIVARRLGARDRACAASVSRAFRDGARRVKEPRIGIIKRARSAAYDSHVPLTEEYLSRAALMRAVKALRDDPNYNGGHVQYYFERSMATFLAKIRLECPADLHAARVRDDLNVALTWAKAHIYTRVLKLWLRTHYRSFVKMLNGLQTRDAVYITTYLIMRHATTLPPGLRPFTFV